MLNYMPSTTEIERVAALGKALSNPKRVAILNLLMQGVQCNCESAARLQLADNLISHHMRLLQDVGLVSSERDSFDARWVYYAVDPAILERDAETLSRFLDVTRLQPRQPSCGPGLCAPLAERS